jgi:hypothetical protein
MEKNRFVKNYNQYLKEETSFYSQMKEETPDIYDRTKLNSDLFTYHNKYTHPDDSVVVELKPTKHDKVSMISVFSNTVVFYSNLATPTPIDQIGNISNDTNEELTKTIEERLLTL